MLIYDSLFLYFQHAFGILGVDGEIVKEFAVQESKPESVVVKDVSLEQEDAKENAFERGTLKRMTWLT